MAFAEHTPVSPEKTRAEIERLVTKYGATKFVSGWEEDGAAVLFEMRGRRIRFSLPLPDRTAKQFTHDRRGRRRAPGDQARAYEQHVRTSWRGLLLVIKAKLEGEARGRRGRDRRLRIRVPPGGPS